MPIITTDEGALEILAAYFAYRLLTLKLFTNNITPLDVDSISNYTEAVGGGYVSKELLAENWFPGIVNGIAQVAQPDQVFNITGELTGNTSFYGYYVVNESTGKAIYSERFDAAITPTAAGGVLIVKPVYKLSHGIPV